ncbi:MULTISPECIES: hypothetical protein [Rubritalea]|nr:hypothetical protein [Rubritalea squalenifaciens]
MKIGKEWFAVLLVALLGVGCLWASHKVKPRTAQHEVQPVKSFQK